MAASFSNNFSNYFSNIHNNFNNYFNNNLPDHGALFYILLYGILYKETGTGGAPRSYKNPTERRV